MGINASQLFFSAFAALALSSAFAVIFTRHTVYAALFFIAHLMCLSVLYALLNAPLIAVLQVMVYAGAVMVLFLFAIMILDASILERMDFKKELTHVGFGAAITLGLGGIFFFAGSRYLNNPSANGVMPALALPSPQDPAAAQAGNIVGVARLLFRQYLLPFELISVLLVVAVIGIVVMAKKKLEP